MNDNLLVQLRTYGSHLESQMSSLALEDIRAPVVVLKKGPHTPRSRWAPVVGAVASVWLIVVSILMFRESHPPAAQDSGPSNGWVAFADQDIFITREGESPRRILGSEGDGLDQSCPTFSPDGTMLAYNENRGPVGTPTIPADVVVVEFDDGVSGPEILRVKSTAQGPGYGCITWSPDSTRVAYVAQDPAHTGLEGTYNQWQLHVATLDGQETILFDYFHGSFDLEWSPDGSAIALKASFEDSYEAIWLVPVGGTAPRLLLRSEFNRAEGWAHFESVTWSPDGSRLAIPETRYEPGRRSDFGLTVEEGFIRIVSVDGTSDETIVTSSHSFEVVVWSPDGTRLAYVDPSVGRVVIVDPDGNDPVMLPSVHLLAGPIWSPDGTGLLVAVDGSRAGEFVFLSTAHPQDPPILMGQVQKGVDLGFGGLSWQAIYPES